MSDTRKTINDPVDAETLARLSDLEQTEMRLGKQLIGLRSDELRIMVAARRIEDERQRLFEKVLIDHGVHPSAVVNIDGTTGRITLTHPGPAETDAAESAPATP